MRNYRVVNYRVKIYIFISLLLILMDLSFAGFNSNVDISSYVDDNLYRSPNPVSEILTNVGIQLGYKPGKSNMIFNEVKPSGKWQKPSRQ